MRKRTERSVSGEQSAYWEYIALPRAPALLTGPNGVVLRATDDVARLAGEPSAAALVGRPLADLVVPDGRIARLYGRADGIPVRPLSWPHPEYPELIVTVLAAVSDLVDDPVRTSTARATPMSPRRWSFTPEAGDGGDALLRSLLTELAVDEEGDWIDHVHPEDLAKAREFSLSLLAEQDMGVTEVELRDAGCDRVFVCTGEAERDAAGEIKRIHGTVQDVTELRALQRRLREERLRFHGSAQAKAGPPSGRVSSVFFDVSGQHPATPATFAEYLASVHPQDRQRVSRAWQRLLDGNTAVEVEHRVVRPDGAIRIVRMGGNAVRRDNDETLLIGTSQDVTEQRAALTMAERSGQRFTDLVTIAPVGIGLFDQDERLVDANDALCDLLSCRLGQLLGRTIEQMTHPGGQPVSLRAAADSAASASGRRSVPQQTLTRSDGQLVHCELHVVLSVRDDGTRFWLVVFQDVTQRRRIANVLHHRATHDELTGLPNRAAVKDLLGRLLSRVGWDKVAVLFCDIDKFKRVNDGLGHDAGDELLVALARRLEGGLPRGCVAARLAGDEFVIICSDVERVGGVDSLTNLVAGLLRTAVPVHGQLVQVSAAVGAAVAHSAGIGGEDLLRFADAAMYEAKRRGAGKVSLAGPALVAAAGGQLRLEGQLREALARDGLTLHYQPVVGPDGALVTVEALVRWPHPDRGMLLPDEFLPAAEQGDLLRELDRWVLRTALREAADWPETACGRAAIAVNLAGLLPGGGDFVETIAEIIADSGVDWRRVVLELVETTLLDLPSRSRAAMGELIGRGVRFAVDDFGTGYSSLARLKELPAQIIKVDRRFVAGVGGDASDFAVARAVVDLARAMGRQCVAEGVETATQFHVLSGVGVDAFQGWLFSGAVCASDLRAMLARGALPVPPGE